MATKNDNGMEIPKSEIESLARLLLPEIQKYFISEAGRLEFEGWKVKKAQAGKEAE